MYMLDRQKWRVAQERQLMIGSRLNLSWPLPISATEIGNEIHYLDMDFHRRF